MSRFGNRLPSPPRRFALRSVSGESCERGARAMQRRQRRGNAASFCAGAGGEGRERERAAAANRGEL